MKKIAFIFLFILGMAVAGEVFIPHSTRFAFAQMVTPPPMASPTPIPIEGLPDFWQNYRAVSPDFWEKVSGYIKEQNWTEVIARGNDRLEVVKKDSLDGGEAQLMQAYGLQRLGFSFAASEIYADLVRAKVGTTVAERGLMGLEDIAINHSVDPDFIYGEILNDVEFAPLPEGLQSFVSFHNAQFNLQHGFDKWGEAELKKISPESFWGLKLKYIDALKEVKNKKIDAAIEKFKALADDPKSHENIKSDATHQLARLIFEKGDYAESYKIFKTIKLSMRERGFILLERAWSRYYMKDYSRALGLLTAYEAPMFDPSRTPEAYILKMIMYKELCHFDAALEVMKEFNDRYRSSLTRIKKRKDLRKDQLLVNMALLDQHYQPWADYLNLLRDEQDGFKRLGWDDYDFYPTQVMRYKDKIAETETRLNRILEDKTREMANLLLDFNEQMTFLDYATRLDSLRIIRRGDELQYRSATIPGLTFDKIYWLFDGEFWLDELEDMKGFIESRCGTQPDEEGGS